MSIVIVTIITSGSASLVTLIFLTSLPKPGESYQALLDRVKASVAPGNASLKGLARPV